jgi:hypothetical protein
MSRQLAGARRDRRNGRGGGCAATGAAATASGQAGARSAAWCMGIAFTLLSVTPPAAAQYYGSTCHDQVNYDHLYAQVVHGAGACDYSVGCAPICREAQQQLRDHECFADYLGVHSCEHTRHLPVSFLAWHSQLLRQLSSDPHRLRWV